MEPRASAPAPALHSPPGERSPSLAGHRRHQQPDLQRGGARQDSAHPVRRRGFLWGHHAPQEGGGHPGGNGRHRLVGGLPCSAGRGLARHGEPLPPCKLAGKPARRGASSSALRPPGRHLASATARVIFPKTPMPMCRLSLPTAGTPRSNWARLAPLPPPSCCRCSRCLSAVSCHGWVGFPGLRVGGCRCLGAGPSHAVAHRCSAAFRSA